MKSSGQTHTERQKKSKTTRSDSHRPSLAGLFDHPFGHQSGHQLPRNCLLPQRQWQWHLAAFEFAELSVALLARSLLRLGQLAKVVRVVSTESVDATIVFDHRVESIITASLNNR